MNESTPQPDAIDQARDRLTDRLLAESLGAESPPDLSRSILDRAEALRVDAAPWPQKQERTMQTRRAWIVLLTTAASLATAVAFLPSTGEFETSIARSEVTSSFDDPALPDTQESPFDKYYNDAVGKSVLSSNATDSAAEDAPLEAVRVHGVTDLVIPIPVGAAVADTEEARKEILANDWHLRQIPPAPADESIVLGVTPSIVVQEEEVLAKPTSVEDRLQPKSESLGELSGSSRASGGVGADAPLVGDLATITSDSDLPFRQGSFQQAAAPYHRSSNGDSSTPVLSKSPITGDGLQRESKLARENEYGAEADDFGIPAQESEAAPTDDLFAAVPPASQPAGGRFRSAGRKIVLGDFKKTPAGVAGSIVQDKGGYRRQFGLEQRGIGKLADQQPTPRYSASEPWYFENRRAEPRGESRDRYAPIHENEFIRPAGGDALSTFSIDVDTASYSNVRQYLLDSRRLPPPNSVRVEELVNYFDYAYEGPPADSEDPFASSMEVGACPWKPEHRLVRIGIQGRRIDADKRPLTNLVFLVDVSGSMNSPNKLPLVVEGLKALTERLGENDCVAIVVYAGSEGVVLPSITGDRKDEIRSALGRLTAGGSTAGGAGLKLAYEIAERNRIVGGVNRVVLCTDGDFNVGLTGTDALTKLVETRAKETSVFLTVLGFGRGNLNDEMLESISGKGNGHYAYIDTEREARRVLSKDLSGTLVTIAKDVKIQVEFNPAKVAAYRLIGYENRVMAAKDFNDDTKDAGEIGAGHAVTALYEVVPFGIEKPAPPVDGLKYQEVASGQSSVASEETPAEIIEPRANSNELLTLKIRYKQPDGEVSKKLEFPLEDQGDARRQETIDFRWAASVAEFGMVLRGSRYVGDATLSDVLEHARAGVGEDEQGYRGEMLDLVRRAQQLRGETR